MFPSGHRLGSSRRAALLGGVSLAALLLAGAPARATALLARSVPSPVSSAMAGAGASAQQAAAMAQQSMASLARATQAIAAMQAAQTAARNLVLAAPSTVPDGLAPGGLVPDSGLASSGTANPVSTWTNANTPVQSTGNDQTLVTVQQTAQKAILNWTSFNIGKNTELYINQSAGNSSTGNGWIALNRIADPSGVPSQILGAIKAEGSVYVINANGIILGGASQVNVSSLIVSSLNLFSNTLATSNNRFLTGGIGDLNTSNFSTDSVLLTTNNPTAGAITIEPGASINLASNGLAVIAAPNVSNSGMITAPSGQVALIAGIGVSYTYNYYSGSPEAAGFTNGSSTLLVFTNSGQLKSGQSDVTPVGALVNNGLVLTPRGNITLLGGTVAQNGVAVATTSVQQAGSIVLTGEYDTTPYTGSVTFGPQAVTAVLPDTNGVTLPSDPTSLAPFGGNPYPNGLAPQLPIQGPGAVTIIGQAIDFQGGSLVYAPGQAISARTLVLPDPRPIAPPVPAPGRILLEDGAILDVSGIPDTEVAAAANLLTVTLGGNELADDPMQQSGPLYGQSVTVDMRLSGTNAETGESWVGTPLANLSSYANLEQNSIGQLLVNGGTISLGANEFIGAPGSIINLTGGYIQYLSGWVQTTRLLGADGHIYNIGSADPLVTYVGIAGQETITDARWGVKNTYTASLVAGGYDEPDYIQGGNAGTLSINLFNTANGSTGNAVADSGALVLESSVLASAAAGTQQVVSGALPTNGVFNFSGVLPIEIGDPGVLSAQSAAATLPPANFSAASPPLATPGSPYAAANVFNSEVLNTPNFDKISLTTLGPSAALVEDPGTSLTVQPGGAISLNGGNVAIEGSLTARAGSISITTQPANAATNTGVPADLMIGASAMLNVSGLFYNDFTDLFEPVAASLVNGGSIALVTNQASASSGADETGNITLAPGSVLDLQSGGHVLANGTLQLDSVTGAPVGRGGNLTLETYQGITRPTVPSSTPSRGKVTVGGTIDALGFDGGGTLTLQAVALQIGGTAAAASAYAYYFDATQWGERGFDNFVLSSVTDAEVPAGAIVRLTHENLLPDLGTIGNAPSGADPAAYASPGFLTGTQLSPTNLSITAGVEEIGNTGIAFVPPGPIGDNATVGLGAQILADPGASISISSETMVAVLGAIHAPGGSISLTNQPNTLVPVGPLYLGPQSVLDVSGVALVNPLPTPMATLGGLVTPYTGQVLPGGKVSLFDDWTPILVAPGAVIDVSGAAGAFDVPQLAPGSSLGTREVLSRQPVSSNAGTVSIEGEAGLALEGTLIGQPGASQAQGGTLTITADSVFTNSGPSLWLVPDTAAALVAAQSPINFATYVPVAGGGPTVVANEPGGVMMLGADSLDGSGFANLALNGAAIGFTGQVSLTLNGSFSNSASQGVGLVPRFSVGPTTSLTITAPYISFGGGIGAAAAGATLTLNAQALDIAGVVSLSVGQATFNSTGDIRLLPQSGQLFGTTTYLFGELLASGNVTFAAADVYPATDTAYLIQGSTNSTVTFTYPTGGGPSSATPLSAGGALWVEAPNIVQNGEIQAPFGSIMLGFTNNDVLGNFYLSSLSTQSVTLGAGSITSVSANGTVIPYGSTIDQTTWAYNPVLANPGAYVSDGSLPQFSAPLTVAPQGVVTLAGAAIAINNNAVVNLDGGGDLQAQEWVPGTGGSRNLLLQSQTSYQNSTTGQQVSTYADGRQIFAILPGYSTPVAPYDATLTQSGLTAGESIYLAGGNGLAAGYYTLLPAQYATLPGAYRVVANSGVTNPQVNEFTLPDGTMEMAGYLANTLAGTRSSTVQQFYVQSAAVWGRYSQYALTSADSFFPAYAATNNLAAPYVPADAGRLAISAINSITLPTTPGTVHGTPAAGGYGAQLDISALNIEITGSSSDAVPTGTIALGAQALDEFGAASLLIGGTRSYTSAGLLITPTANAVTVAGDAVLEAPELMLVATPQFQSQSVTLDRDSNTATISNDATISVPVAGTGQVTIDSGAIVAATGTVGSGEPTTIVMGSTLASLPTLPSSVLVSEIQNASAPFATLLSTYYSTLDAALGTLVRVSNGSPVTVELPSLAQLNPSFTVTDNVNTANAAFTPVLPSLASAGGSVIQPGAQVLGGNSLTLASTGNTQILGGALLSGTNIQATSSEITFVGAGAPPATGGAVINPATLVQLQNAQSVDLQSATTINFVQGNVDLQMSGSGGSLTLSAGALSSDGSGTVSISAPTVVLDNELGATVPSFAAGTGTLTINAGELVFGTGAKTLTGFGTLNVVANQGVVGQGSGSMNFGSVPLTLETPIVIADTGSSQTISTTNADINLVPLAGATAMASSALGGAITFETQQSGAITVAIPIQALAGNISLETGTNTGATTGGNVTVTGSGQLIAHGVAVPFFDETEYASGGAITLSANAGTVVIQPGAVVNFSGAPGGGNGGSLAITTANSTAPVSIATGTLFGATAPGAGGSSFSLNTGGSVVLDSLAQILSGAGVTGSISVESSGQGDLTLDGPLTASQVALVADDGKVTVNGTITASGTSTAVGEIDLYGATGVDIEGSLVATGSPNSQSPGGLINIGTTGTGSTTSLNANYGYENVSTSGTITVGSNALIDASGGAVTFRAPLLSSGSVNLSLPSSFAPGKGIFGGSVTLEAYAVWSTADQSTNPNQHFDGIIDPAGWYDSTGTLLPGSFTNTAGAIVATWNGSTLTNDDGTTNSLSYYLNIDYFSPNATNTDSTRTAHETFYGYVNGDSTAAVPGALMSFVEAPGFQSVAYSSSIHNFQETPGIELDDPITKTATGAIITNGNIQVLSNWNLGAQNASGTPLYRYNGTAPVLTVRAAGNITIDASITDGFTQVGQPLYPAASYDTYADASSIYSGVASRYSGTAIGQLTYLTAALLSLNADTTGGLALIAPTQPTLLTQVNGTNSLDATNTLDQYYKNWDAYETDYAKFYTELTFSIYTTDYSTTGLTPATTLTSPKATAGDIADATKLISATTTLTQDSNYTNLSTYGAYLAAYATYAADYLTWAEAVRSLHIASLIQPPGAPPQVSVAYSQPSFAQANSPNVVASLNNQAAIAGMALSNEASSTSYRFVAGADFSSAGDDGSADPSALNLATSANVTIDQHTTLQVNATTPSVIVMPTIVRTGTGSIDIAASGNLTLADPLAPGVVYTAGEAQQAPTASDAATIATGLGFYYKGSGTAFGISTLLTGAVNAYGAGNLTINVLGDISGIENVTDTLAQSSAASGLTSVPGAFVGQFWDAWLLTNPSNPSIPWYVNFGSFDQGIMSVGGNVTVHAGGDIHDLAVSLPTTGYLDPSNALHVTGGGNLSVIAGGSIYSGDFYVGQGAGTINAGGAIASDFNFTPVIDPSHTFPVATLLAVQYGTIDVNARSSVDIGGVYDPTYLWAPNMFTAATALPVASVASAGATPIDLMPYVTSMSTNSGVSVEATSGNVTFNSLLAQADLFALGATVGVDYPEVSQANAAAISSLLLPASLNLVALEGGISVDHGGGLYPSATGTLSLIASQSIDLSVPELAEAGAAISVPPTFPSIGNVFGYTLGKLDYPIGTGILPTASDPAVVNVWTLQIPQIHDPALLSASVADPVTIESLNGSLVDGFSIAAGMPSVTDYLGHPITIVPVGGTVNQITLIPNAPALIHVGGNITDLPFYGENFTAGDITSIIAGGNISSNIFGALQPMAIELAGPGALEVIAGGSITFQSQRGTPYETGIRTLGNSLDPGAYPIYGSQAPLGKGIYDITTTILADFGNPYLPTGGASVDALFGVGPGIDYTAFVASYLNPATAIPFASSGTWQFQTATGQPSGSAMTPAQYWSYFETLTPEQQKLAVLYDFFAILNAVGLDETNPSSAYYHQYSNGYQAIDTLFPASYGYTQNSLSGGTDGANQLVRTGDLDIRGSTIQTQQGGNISILGPGGRILVGSADAAPAVNPASEGILTLEKGNIDTFTDTDVLVAQSRIMTEQGGAILMWSSNGNLDAGAGAKTSVSAPPPKFDCDVDYRCTADIKGQVSGAGIATLQSLPGVPVGSANLIAPRGTVNAGAAGIRVSGNLNIAALIVANTFNIQVQGTTTGIPAAVAPNIGSLTSASNAAGQAAAAATDAAKQARSGPPPQELPSIITVEVVGYGGGDSDKPQTPQNERRRSKDQRSENPAGAVRVVGAGDLSDQEKQILTDEEKRNLVQ
jgi:filamentous hemagglutinin family protein